MLALLWVCGCVVNKMDRRLASREMIFSRREMISYQNIKSKLHGVLKGDHCSERGKAL